MPVLKRPAACSESPEHSEAEMSLELLVTVTELSAALTETDLSPSPRMCGLADRLDDTLCWFMDFLSLIAGK